MWVIVVWLLIVFAVLLFSRIAKTPRMRSDLIWLGLALWSAPMFLTSGNKSAQDATFYFPLLSLALSDLLAVPIFRRRITPPCVRVTKLREGWAAFIIGVFLGVAIVIYLLIAEGLRSLAGIVLGSIPVLVIVFSIISVCLPPEICGNGVWQDGKSQPWEEFAYFAWRPNEKYGVELSIETKSVDCNSALVTVPREDREAVQQLLKAHLPDRSMDSGAYLA